MSRIYEGFVSGICKELPHGININTNSTIWKMGKRFEEIHYRGRQMKKKSMGEKKKTPWDWHAN